MLEIPLTGAHPHAELESVNTRATAEESDRRQASVAVLQAEWRSAVGRASHTCPRGSR